MNLTDTIRVIQLISPGQGDYTQERYAWLDQTPLEDILTSMEQHREDDIDQYDEIIE